MRLSYIHSVVLVFFCIINLEAQEKFLSLSLSNNGQVKDTFDDFHFGAWGLYPIGTEKYNDTKLKFDALLESSLKNNWYLMAKIGYGFSTDRYAYDVVGSNGKMTQRFYDIALGLTYHVNVEKVMISTGFSIPFTKISDLKRTDDVFTVGSEHVLKTNYKGGYSTGLNSMISFRINVVKKIYVVTAVEIGVMYMKTGGDYWIKQDFNDPGTPDAEIYDSNSLFRSIRISKPDFSIGIGYSFN